MSFNYKLSKKYVSPKTLIAPVLINVCWLFACNTKVHTKNEIDAAMQQYDRLIKKKDTDSIALVYTEDGDMGTVAHGRDSIRKFLVTFRNFKVLSQSSNSQSVNISGDSALQKGSFHISAKERIMVVCKDLLLFKSRQG